MALRANPGLPDPAGILETRNAMQSGQTWEEARNPNLEIRSKSESRMAKILNPRRFEIASFAFRVCFGFRDSDFGFGPEPRVVRKKE
jgi:hypothetical protein